MEVDLFWSFRSPWSYFATKRLRAMRDDYQMSVQFRPVYPIAIRTEDQPHIYRLTKLGIVAQNLGRGIEFADEVSSLIWGGTKNWHNHLDQATEKAGLDLAEMDKLVLADSEKLEEEIQSNQLDHEKAGHWGVPTFAFNGEGFFGQDHLDVLL